ncbi:hypothetical protein [Aquiflexum lacus]|uniref:hypothetical protein n=1 Tax=Aquiflexum lacus TaxID=2483805 RepID=UPI0018944539|nr:hypothetical protein [Aquiflexum lacus]
MRASAIVILIFSALLVVASYNSIGPFHFLSEWRAKYKSGLRRSVDKMEYQIYDCSDNLDPFITIDFLKGAHFWHPQVAIWIESVEGEYIKSLLVTTSTAKGIFYGGRTAENFKDFDQHKSGSHDEVRRVNALPHWAFTRNVKAKDGLYAPHPDEPLPDGITGATPSGNFRFFAERHVPTTLDSFVVKMEINVAFDENKFYSAYDYLDDDAYHSGTGLLGQPSLIYSSTVIKQNPSAYYLMELIGHGHHSGQNGAVYNDLSQITTAKEIVERILVKMNW